MKILHLINYFNDELNYQENFLTKYQADLGHKVQVITSDRFYPFENYNNIYFPTLGQRIIKKKKYKINKVQVVRKKTFFETKKHAQCLFFNLYDIFKFNPDVIHIHNTGTITFFSTFFYCSLFKKKLFVDCHSDAKNSNNNLFNKINNLFWTLIYNIFKNTIIKFLPINKSSKDFIIQSYNIKEEKIEIIPLGFEKFKKTNTLEIQKLRSEYKFDKKDIIIFNSGKINEEKKTLQLINLLEILLRYNNKFKLLLVGEASNKYSNELQKKINSLNSKFNNSIKWLSFQKNNKLRCLMCMTDIAIWPGIPSISIQEAMYCNNIILLPKTSSSYHLVSDEKLTFYNNNILKTAKNILEIFKKKNLKNKVILKNTIKIQSLNWNSISKKLLALYEKK